MHAGGVPLARQGQGVCSSLLACLSCTDKKALARQERILYL